MPTMRLGDGERSTIINAFGKVAKRATNSKIFPLVEDDFPEFGYSLLPYQVAEAYKFLKDNHDDLVNSSSTFAPDFRIHSEDHAYKVELYAEELPCDGLIVPDSHPRYTELITWAQEYNSIIVRVSSAMHYLGGIINECSSMGQIRRVLSDEIIQFVPDYMQESFKDAERRSRIPKNVTLNADRHSELADILAIGSLSPENISGINAKVTSRTTI